MRPEAGTQHIAAFVNGALVVVGDDDALATAMATAAGLARPMAPPKPATLEALRELVGAPTDRAPRRANGRDQHEGQDRASAPLPDGAVVMDVAGAAPPPVAVPPGTLAGVMDTLCGRPPRHAVACDARDGEVRRVLFAARPLTRAERRAFQAYGARWLVDNAAALDAEKSPTA